MPPSFSLDATALEGSVDPIVIIDDSHNVVMWNRAATELYGITAGESIGRPFSDLVSVVPDRSLAFVGERAANSADEDDPDRSLRAAGLVDGAALHVGESGQQIPVRVSVVPVRQNGDRPHYLLVILDQTEQVRRADTLHERLDLEMLISEISGRFSHIADDDLDAEIERCLGRLMVAIDVDCSSFAQILPDAMPVVTHSCAAQDRPACPRGRVEVVLPWLTQMLMAARPMVAARIPDDLPADAEAERRYFVERGMKAGLCIPVLIGGAPVCALTFGAFRQTRRWPAGVIARLRLAGDAFGNAIARRAAKQRLDEKQFELAHVGRVASMGELASVIAHELDQPLTAVVGNADALQRSLRSAEPNLVDADEALQEIKDAAMRASEIVRRERQLLRKGSRTIEPVDLNDVVREIELFIRAEARQWAGRVVLELLPGLPAIPADRVLVQQVVFNLARNGLHAMRTQPAGSRTLTIGTAFGTDAVALTVVDEGPPVDAVVLGRMFEPFYTTKPDGLGMGLSISKSIVDNHRGRIWADSNASGGLTMHVSLPRK
jgi:PAS domain S-box-containing protein